jgi:16S rRNA (cytosine967-C5)-methyltransferase
LSFDPARVFPARLAILQRLLESYDGSVPFAGYLKSFFRQNRNFGSRDRAFYSKWSYAYYRFGNALAEFSFRERLAATAFLLNFNNDGFGEFLHTDRSMPEQAPDLAGRLDQLKIVYPEFDAADIFPFKAVLSRGLTLDEYVKSMLIRPDVWIRMVRGKETKVKQELLKKNISFREDIGLPQALALEPEVKLDELESRAKGFFEIQDRSSQLAAGHIPAVQGEHWWDCCCGAGGKSLELLDRVPGLKITATDSRPSILDNFRSRTSRYTSRVTASVTDLLLPVPERFTKEKFDGIVADVPCSGSGTWGRTPENLIHFDENRLEEFSERQYSIVKNIIPCLKTGGKLVYITCSVFKCENEDMVSRIAAETGLTPEQGELINGTLYNCDSMFYTIFNNPPQS